MLIAKKATNTRTLLTAQNGSGIAIIWTMMTIAVPNGAIIWHYAGKLRRKGLATYDRPRTIHETRHLQIMQHYRYNARRETLQKMLQSQMQGVSAGVPGICRILDRIPREKQGEAYEI